MIPSNQANFVSLANGIIFVLLTMKAYFNRMKELFLYNIAQSLPDNWQAEKNYFLNLIKQASPAFEQQIFDSWVNQAAQIVVPDRGGSNTPGVVPVFHRISQQNNETSPPVFPHRPMTINKENGFPLKQVKDKDRSDHLKDFRTRVHQLINTEPDLEQAGKKLFHIFAEYGWCISAAKNPDTLSLFEFMKSRGAFAHCLGQKDAQTEHPFLLVSGDISGIQDFIYNIHASKAAMTMKGRSFYLHILLDAILRKILHDTQTPVGNIVYAAGGKFFLLLPHTPTVVEYLEGQSGITNHLLRNLFPIHQMELYVALGFVAFNLKPGYYFEIETPATRPNGEPVKNMSTLWEAASAASARKKQLWYKDLLIRPSEGEEEEKDVFFENIFRRNRLEERYNGEGMTICSVTGRPMAIDRKNSLNPDARKDDRIYVLEEVKAQSDLGRALKEAQYLSITDQKVSENWYQPLNLGVFYKLSKGMPNLSESDLIVLNPSGKQAQKPKPGAHFPEIMFYGGSRQADGRNDPTQLFEDLINSDYGKKLRFSRLGILRIDVDNLGDLFTRKMQDKRMTSLADYSALSTQVNWFFSGYINELRNHKTFKDKINVIYAGGDDLFAIGRWDKIIDFATRIRNDFREFTGGSAHEDEFTLSAGIVFVTAKFPIAKAADMAGEALDLAKAYQPNPRKKMPDKNAIHLLDTTVGWGREFEFVYDLSQELAQMFRREKLSKAFIYKLFDLQKIKNQPPSKTNRLRWWWQATYILGQAEKGLKGNHKPLFQALKKTLIVSQFKDENQQKELKLKFGNKKLSLRANYGRMLDLICLAGKLADYYSR
jgi:CRISPR-associated protein Csm1